MELVLHKSDFVNDRFTVSYGSRREAQFIAVNEWLEERIPNATLPLEIAKPNKIVIITRQLDENGTPGVANMQGAIIAFGNPVPGGVGVRSALPELRGKVLNWDNMEQCTVILYDEDNS